VHVVLQGLLQHYISCIIVFFFVHGYYQLLCILICLTYRHTRGWVEGTLCPFVHIVQRRMRSHHYPSHHSGGDCKRQAHRRCGVTACYFTAVRQHCRLPRHGHAAASLQAMTAAQQCRHPLCHGCDVWPCTCTRGVGELDVSFTGPRCCPWRHHANVDIPMSCLRDTAPV
jgi:hypothetical protein